MTAAKKEGRPYGHNIALCPYSRYRFGVDLNRTKKPMNAEHQTKLHLHHAEAVNNMDPSDFDVDEDEYDDMEAAGGKIFMLKGTPDGMSGNNMASEECDDDKEEVVNLSSSNDESNLLIHHSGAVDKEDEFDQFEKDVEKAMSMIPTDVKVLGDEKQIKDACRFILINSPFVCVSALKRWTDEKLAIDECYFSRDLKLIDETKERINKFKIKNSNKSYIVTTAGQKLFNNVKNISTKIHKSCANMALLGYVRLNINVFVDKDKINKLSKLRSVYVYSNVSVDKMKEGQKYHCQVTVFLIEDSGCSHSCLVDELLDLIEAEKVRECVTKINTASDEDIQMNDYYYALDCQTRSNKASRICVQRLSRSALPMDRLSDNQIKLISQELGDINGVKTEELLGCMRLPNLAWGLVGQNCKYIKMTEVNEPRHLGFSRGKIYHQNLKVYETSNICLNDVCITGELGLDPGTISKDSVMVIPEEYVIGHQIREQFQIPNHLLRNIGVYLTEDKDKHTCVNQVEVTQDRGAFLRLDLKNEALSGADIGVNDEAVGDLCNIYSQQSSQQYITKADAAVVTDYILAESCQNIINPLCKVHLDLSRRDAANCLDCKLLQGDRQATIDKAIHNSINNNIKLEKNPNREGKLRLRQKLTFTHKVEDIANIGASNLEASIRRFEKLVKKALKNGFWDILNTQVVDRVKRGEMMSLEPEEMRKILNGDIMAQFVAQSYVEAPGKSTKFRLICDSSMMIKGLETSIAGTNRSPRVELQNFVSVTTSQRFLSCFIALDLQRAYNSVLLDAAQSYLFCTPWCSQPEQHGTERLFLLRMLCLSFGMGSAGSDLKSGVIVHGVPRMKLEESKYLTILKTFVDNLNSLSSAWFFLFLNES